jgi:AcrR family transcriptional regulator
MLTFAHALAILNMFKSRNMYMHTVEKITKSERTKEMILQQALFLFQQDGYESVTMRDLAKACELSLGAFYYHFKNKEEIVLEIFKASLIGHAERTRKYLSTHKSSLEATMIWVCRDRFQEFGPYQAVLRALSQKLDPHDPISPWHKSSLPIREQSIELFEEIVVHCFSSVDAETKRQLARGLWLQHLLILGCWSFDRSPDFKKAELLLNQSAQLWKSLPTLVKIPGIKLLLNIVLSPLEHFEKEDK